MHYPGTGLDIRHPHDSSVFTYRGHSVLQTLIRCRFAPECQTGGRLLYSASQRGGVHVFDIQTGAVVRRLDYHTEVGAG